MTTLRNFFAFVLALVVFACQKNTANQTVSMPLDWHKTFFEQTRPPQNKAETIAQWKKDTFTDKEGLTCVKRTPMRFWADNLDDFFSDYFTEEFDPEYAVKKDADGQYLIARNGNRTVSFNEISFSHINGNIGIGSVYFDSLRCKNESAATTTSKWIIFDKEFTVCDTLNWAGSYSGGYALSDKGVWNSPGGKGLNFRSYKDLFGGRPVPETYALVVEEKRGGYYLTLDPEQIAGKSDIEIFLDKK